MTLLIQGIFQRDPKREIERVVRIDHHDPNLIKTELEEYVVTDEIEIISQR